MANFAQLPSEVLVHILKHVKFEHRISRCSLVHSTWAAAAVAATDSIRLGADADLCIRDFIKWLGKNVGHLNSLRFSADWQNVPCIPCSNLRNLEVTCASLQLQHPCQLTGSMLDAATGLTRLVLQWCNMATEHDTLSALSVLTDLRHLELHMVGLQGADLQAYPHDVDAWAPIPGSLFAQLRQLTSVELRAGSGGATQETFQHLGCLTDLQHLTLAHLLTDPNDDLDQPTTEGMAGLSKLTQLTCLRFEECLATFRPHSTPLLTPLTNLRQLHLVEVNSLDPIVLAGMTQMQEFVLSCIELEGEEAGVAALLAALQHMQQLTYLWLDNAVGYCLEAPEIPELAVGPSADPSSAAAALQLARERQAAAVAAAVKPYAALTASSRLQKLALTDCILPEGAWQHVFSWAKYLPQLTHLEIIIPGQDEEPTEESFMTSADLRRLVWACPRLVTLRLGEAAVQSGASLAPLLRLTGLTELQVHGVQQRADVDVLLQMTGLQALRLKFEGDAVGRHQLQDLSGMGLRSCCVIQDDRAVLQFGWRRW
jgi:hypothetical protein